MWLPGHFAVALILCLPLLLYLREQRGLALVYVAFFSVLPDFLHSGSLRMASHSLLGWGIMITVALVVLGLTFRPRPGLMVIAVVASGAHLLADLYIGSIYPFYPWSSEYYIFHSLNTVFAFRVEAVFIVLAAGIFLLLLRPWSTLRNVRTYSPSQRRNLLVLVLPFGLMSLVEGGYFFLFFFRSQPLTVTGVEMLAFLAVIAFCAVMTLLALLPSTARADDREGHALRQLY